MKSASLRQRACIHACLVVLSVFQALVGEKACYQSVSSYGGQIVYLGTKVPSGAPCHLCFLCTIFILVVDMMPQPELLSVISVRTD